MLQVSDAFRAAMTAPVRQFAAEVRLQEDANNPENISIYTHEDRIKKIEIQRVGDNSKFFGYGICQRLSIEMVDLPDEITPISHSSLKIYVGIKLEDGSTEYVSYPTFYMNEKNRHEEAGDITLTAYDKIYDLSNHFVSELDLTAPYTLKQFIEACAAVLDLYVVYEGLALDDTLLNLEYPNGANFEGTENLRDALNAAAEATQTIYFIDYGDKLRFKRLSVSGEPIATITPEDYFALSHSDNRRLVKVAHVTELGDNVESESTITGTTQYIRNNPFWEMREDIGEIVDAAAANVYGLTIHQFDCSWRGFPLLEIGDKIELQQVCVEGCVEDSYVLDDVITYDGGYSQETQWTYQNSNAETETTPTNIGEALGQTYAKVDKLNRQITLVASDIQATYEEIAAIRIDTESISQSVTDLQRNVDSSIEGIEGTIDTLTRRVDQTITAEAVETTVKTIIEQDGVTKVITTGSRFDEDGLTISKSGSELETTISHDGMVIRRDDMEVLRADNQGVNAANLHATTYLIIGTNSRFEDYDNNTRTGCFWVGN
jgi:hypothetical protein